MNVIYIKRCVVNRVNTSTPLYARGGRGMRRPFGSNFRGRQTRRYGEGTGNLRRDAIAGGQRGQRRGQVGNRAGAGTWRNDIGADADALIRPSRHDVNANDSASDSEVLDTHL
ncbi:hypothetical protein BaRGS_00039626 [Batillaria attramentaria]|uniref:Uncharacterized protein n=1 Tax=Batillaria attramentaria TaxID=370345 RepID=A0ABD0J338_9CAEN